MTRLGIDIGSWGVKGARVDLADGSITSAQAGVQLHSPYPGWAEADPGQWWAGVCAVSRELASAGSPVEAVACSGMVPAVLALDERGRPLRRAILQNDARADAEVEELAEELSDPDLVALPGSALTQQSVAPMLRWLPPHSPI